MHILSPETDNCPSWISGRERMTVENISWSISTKECCRPQLGLKPRPPGLQSDGASNWATEAGAQNLRSKHADITWYRHAYLILQAYLDAFECYCYMILLLIMSLGNKVMPKLDTHLLARWDYVPGELMLSPSCWRRCLPASASGLAQCLSFQRCA